jgi:predicted Co/Zn/Cd cation transporter (cation efflux family)
MVQRVRRFSIAQTAKVIGLLYAVMGLIFLPIFVIVALAAPREAGFGIGFALVLPILYGVMGFIVAAIGCALYNWVAGMVGGVEVELDASGPGS